MPFFLKRIVPPILVVSFLTGCWGRTEVNDIAIVTATGMDLTENGSIRLTLLIAVPRLVGTSSMTGGGGESKLETTAGWVVSEQGKTVMEAYRRIQGKLPREIFFSHNRVIVIGEKLARKGVMPILDFFERNRQSQLNSYILVTGKEAAEMLEFQPKFEKLASEIMKEEMKIGTGTSVRLGRFLTMLMDEGEEPYAPQITIVPSKRDESDSKKAQSLMTGKGTAVFREDRLIGWLNEKETRGLMWVRNEMREGVITVNIPEESGGGYVSAEIGTVRSKMTPVMRNGDIRMKLDLSASLNVSENASDLVLGDLNNIGLLRILFADVIRQRVEMMCGKVQKKLRSDILGFGQAVYRRDPHAWRTLYAQNWNSRFPDIKVEITASVKVLQTGLVGKDVKREDRP